MKSLSSSHMVADIVAFVHFLWVIFFWGGTLLIVFYHPYAVIQAWVLVVAFVFKIPLNNNCILTIIEEKLRGTEFAGRRSSGSFLATYTNKIFGTDVSAKTAKSLFLVFFILSCGLTIFALVYP